MQGVKSREKCHSFKHHCENIVKKNPTSVNAYGLYRNYDKYCDENKLYSEYQFDAFESVGV